MSYVSHLERKIFGIIQRIQGNIILKQQDVIDFCNDYQLFIERNKKKKTEQILKQARKIFLSSHLETVSELIIEIQALKKLYPKTKVNPCQSYNRFIGGCGGSYYNEDADLWTQNGHCSICIKYKSLMTLGNVLTEMKDYYLFSKVKYLFLFKYFGNLPQMKQNANRVILRHIHSFLSPRFDLHEIKKFCKDSQHFFLHYDFEIIFPWYPKLNFKTHICLNCYKQEDSPYRGTKFFCKKCMKKNKQNN